MPDLDRRAVRDALDDELRRCAHRSRSGRGRRDLDEGSVDLGPARDLADVELVPTERARHAGVDLEEERHRSDERRDVVAVRAQREVAMTVHRRGRGEHHRTLRRLPQQPRHLAEVVRDELTAPLVERRAGHRREEVRHVQQVVAHGAVQVGPVVERVHLVHANAAEAIRVRLDRVEDGHRLAVGERHDQVGAVLDVVEHVFRRPWCRSLIHGPGSIAWVQSL